MGIQNSLNSVTGSLAAAAVAGKHVKNQQAALKAQDEREIGQAENIMTEAALKGSGKFSDAAIKGYLAASMLGMKPTPEYQPKYDAMRAEVAQTVTNSEAFAKMQQDRAYRQRILDLGSTQEGRDSLKTALSPFDKEDNK